MNEIKIEKLDNTGRGICYINDKITFVENALPNEIVNIKITKEYKKYNEAIVIDYIEYTNLIETVSKIEYSLLSVRGELSKDSRYFLIIFAGARLLTLMK